MYISCWLYFLLFVITNDINHFFRCLLHLGSLSEKCQLCPLLIFPYHSSSFYYWLFKSYLYILNVILFLPSLNFYFEIFQTNTIIIIEFPTVDTVPHLLYLSFFLWCKHAAVCVLSRVTPWTVACQACLSRGFPKQEYWSGLPFPTLGDFPHPEI